MPTIESGEFVTEAYSMALDYLTKILGAERALVVVRQNGNLQVKGSRGFQADNILGEGDLSLSVLHKVLDKGTPDLRADVQSSPDDSDQLSLQISGIESYLCIPFWEDNGRFGLLYGDSKNAKTKFSRNHSNRAVRFARHLERSLGTARNGSRVEPYKEPLNLEPRRNPWPAAPAPERVVPQAPKPTPPKTLPHYSLDIKERISVFRALYMLLQAGIPISQSLELISEQGETESVRSTAMSMSRFILNGLPLSEAAAKCGKSFRPFHVEMIKLGEETGRLPATLQALFEQEKRTHELKLKVQSVMTYPVIVLLICSAFLIAAPSFLLKGQLQLMAQTGRELPALTKGMLFCSNFLSSPWGISCLLAVFLATLGLYNTIQNRPSTRRAFLQIASHLPGLGPAIQHLALTRFARALALCLKVGMPITRALSLAAAITENPIFVEAGGTAREGIKKGLTLGESLDCTTVFPTLFVEFVKVGEESGAVSSLVDHAAQLSETKLEEALDAYTSLLEPLVLLFLGGITGLTMLATMLPLVNALQAL